MTKAFTGYRNNERQNEKNAYYPIRENVSDCDSFKQLVCFDHTVVRFKDSYRKKENFLSSNCVMLDVDNTHSEKPEEWITPQNVRDTFPGVPFYVCFSRNHLKEKDGKQARPKFHVYFPINEITDCGEYERLKEAVCSYFSYFDKFAKDAARFFFGVESPQVRFFDGDTLLPDFMKQLPTDKAMTSVKMKGEKQTVGKESVIGKVIPKGERNSTMFKRACTLLRKHGDTSECYRFFLEESKRCSPPLEDAELQGIWKSARKHSPCASETIPESKWELPIKDYKIAYALLSLNPNEKKMTVDTVRKVLKAYGLSVRFNKMNRSTEVSGLPKTYSGDDAESILVSLLVDWGNTNSFKKCTQSLIYNIVNVIAHQNAFHPVLKLLEEADWDGKDRMVAIYDILGVKDDFHKSLIRKWALQTIAVLYNSEENPIAAQGLLVLQGAQGLGKTQFFSHLAIDSKFFKGGATLDMGNKDSMMSATKVWICELGEIDHTTKKEQSALKSFLTEQKDHYREPYAPKEITPLRMTSFCGTVNPKQYLSDVTGNRRFWTVPVTAIDLTAVFDLERDWYIQFWRQIQKEFLSNPKSYLLTAEEQIQLNEANAEYESSAHGEDEFFATFDVEADKSLWKPMTVAAVCDILNEEHKSLNLHASAFGRNVRPRLEARLGEFQRVPKKAQRLYLFPPKRNGTETQKTDYRHTEPPEPMVKIQAQQPDVEPMMCEADAHDDVQF